MDILPQAKFQHGKICCTEEVRDLMRSDPVFKKFATKSLAKYMLGNWGNVISDDEWYRNDRAARIGSQINACYEEPDAPFPSLNIMTEAHGIRTIMFFSEVH